MQLPLLTDSQCHRFLKELREFGYPQLTFAEVRKAADAIHNGTNSDTDVIAVIMRKQIVEAVEDMQ